MIAHKLTAQIFFCLINSTKFPIVQHSSTTNPPSVISATFAPSKTQETSIDVNNEFFEHLFKAKIIELVAIPHLSHKDKIFLVDCSELALWSIRNKDFESCSNKIA